MGAHPSERSLTGAPRHGDERGIAGPSPVRIMPDAALFHVVKLTMQREIAPYKWVHPDEDERR
jgi:hypothetical protein